MPELCLLMFLIGCGYVLYQSITTIRYIQKKSLPFSIASAQKIRLLWGFVFYGFAIWLMTDFTAFKSVLLFFAVTLTIYTCYLTFHRCFFYGGLCPIAFLIKHRLLKKNYPTDKISADQALSLLGLDMSDRYNNKLIESMYQKITLTLQKRRFVLPELEKILKSAYHSLIK